MNGTWSIEDAAAARAWTEAPASESQKPIEFLRAPTARSGTDAISAADAQITEALMLCVRELMEFHRAALVQAARTGSDRRPPELDC